MSFDVPILFCIYNRPELTARTFAEIAKVKPRNLLIAGDGPKTRVAGDVQLVEQARRVVHEIDWNCNLQACFSNENLGCREQMARAITWGFDQFESLIILEDDCLPNPSFFSYCRDLLDRYAESPEVMMISGINHLPIACPYDYRFSKYPLIWGWASWRRAWKQYELEMSQWSDLTVQSRVLERYTENVTEREYWRRIFEAQARGQINTWDYSWIFCSWLNDGLTIVPARNLVSNIGFGPTATHTLDGHDKLANFPTSEVHVRHHPPRIVQDAEWDQAAGKFYYSPPGAQEATKVEKLAKRSLMARLFGGSQVTQKRAA